MTTNSLYLLNGKWHDPRDDEFPNSSDPDRCHRCAEHAAINIDQLCSVCSADDPSWPPIPTGAESEFAAAVARTTAKIAQRRVVRIAHNPSVRTEGETAGPFSGGHDCWFGPSPGAA